MMFTNNMLLVVEAFQRPVLSYIVDIEQRLRD